MRESHVAESTDRIRASGSAVSKGTPLLMMPAFSRGDLVQGRAEIVTVIQVYVGDRGKERSHHIRGIEAATQPDLDDGNLDPPVSERDGRRGLSPPRKTSGSDA